MKTKLVYKACRWCDQPAIVEGMCRRHCGHVVRLATRTVVETPARAVEWLTANGVTSTVANWAFELRIQEQSLRNRLAKLSPDDAVRVQPMGRPARGGARVRKRPV